MDGGGDDHNLWLQIFERVKKLRKKSIRGFPQATPLQYRPA
jgi:hypothetical protein